MKLRKLKQLEMKGLKGWGGKRKGAGRKNQTGTINHLKRERVNSKTPIHVTMKLRHGLPDIQCPEMHEKFKAGALKAKALGLRVVHYTVEWDHIHMLLECSNNKALSQGMKSLGASFGRAIRKFAGGKGRVFKERFHMRVLKTPTEVRNAMAYVLTNTSKHHKMAPGPTPYSSGMYFSEWKKLLGRRAGPNLREFVPLTSKLPEFLCEPKSWLAREGWRKVA
jgi:hypothetical protein